MSRDFNAAQSDAVASELAALVRLREVSDRLWHSHDLHEGLTHMLDAGIALLRADMGNIQLFNPSRQVLEIAVHRGFGPGFLEFFREVSAVHHTACGRSLHSRERRIIEDVDLDPEYGENRSAAAAAGYRAVQSTPLLARNGQPVGMFSTHFREPHRPSDCELRLFDLYARQATDFIERLSSEQQRHRTEAMMQAMLETAAQAILAVHADGRIMLVNAAAEKMFGHSRQVLLGQPIAILIPERSRARHLLHRDRWFAEPRSRPMGIGLDLAALRKDGSEFPIEVSLSSIQAGEETLAVAFLSDITERKETERTLLAYKERLQQLATSLIAAQEEANRKVARELHDVFSQELAAVGMELSLLREKLGVDRQMGASLADLRDRVARLAAALHKTSHELHPAILEELGLELALREECETFEAASGIPTEFASANVPSQAGREVALCLYRVAQESLRNVRKHSESVHVQVRLEGSKDGLTLLIGDSGDGFDLDQALKKGGLGLISMDERVRQVHGKLSIESEPGKGTVVTVHVPLGTRARDGAPDAAA